MKFGLIVSFILALNLGAESMDAVSVTAASNNTRVYVNQEIILTLELKSRVRLHNGNLAKPEIADAIVESLVEEDQKELIEDGSPVLVFRRVYAVYPKKPGELKIPAISFEGTIADNSNRGIFGFFSSGRRVSASSLALSIQVDDVPSYYPANQPFLPLKSLAIIEAFDEPDPQFKVNQATTRRFEIKALGTLSSFLPALDPPKLSGVQVYSENGQRTNKNSEDGMEANWSFSHVYMPTIAGALSVPERLIYWWDTDKNELKTTSIRALSVNVIGDNSDLLPKNLNPLGETKAESLAVPSAPNYWPLIAALFAALWLITLAFLLKKIKAPTLKKSSEPAILALRKRLAQALKQEDSLAVYRTLAEIKKFVLKNSDYLWLLALINPLISELEQLRYRDHDNQDLGAIFTSIDSLLDKINHETQSQSGLAPLYPALCL